MATLRFKTFLLVSLLLLITPFSHGMVEGGMQAKYSSLEQGGKGMIQMRSSRKLLMGAMLDYDDTGANPKHDPRKKPGKP